MPSLPWRPPRWVALPGRPDLADDGKMTLAAQDVRNCALLQDRKHDDRHAVFLSKREGSGVHDLQPAIKRSLVAKPLIARGRGVALGIGSIDPIHVGCLEDSVAPHLG